MGIVTVAVVAISVIVAVVTIAVIAISVTISVIVMIAAVVRFLFL